MSAMDSSKANGAIIHGSGAKGRSPPPHGFAKVPQRPQRPQGGDPRLDQRVPWDRGQAEYTAWEHGLPPSHMQDPYSMPGYPPVRREQVAERRPGVPPFAESDHLRWENGAGRGQWDAEGVGGPYAQYGHHWHYAQSAHQYDDGRRYGSPQHSPSPPGRYDGTPVRWGMAPVAPHQWESPRLVRNDMDSAQQRDMEWSAKILQVKQVAASVEQVSAPPLNIRCLAWGTTLRAEIGALRVRG